jgi:hypothetical protein
VRHSSTNGRALITSPTYAATSGECLRFYYHIGGSGSLMVYTPQPGAGLGSPVWSRTGSQGGGWQKGEVTISSRSRYNVSVVILQFNVAQEILWGYDFISLEIFDECCVVTISSRSRYTVSVVRLQFYLARDTQFMLWGYNSFWHEIYNECCVLCVCVFACKLATHSCLLVWTCFSVSLMPLWTNIVNTMCWGGDLV